jgi:DNA-binding HxlR family transcriptional regulator
MYERKIKDDLECGITIAMRVFGAKWKACIVDAIDLGYTRPSAIHRYIPAATPRVLDMQLSELFEHGIVDKKASEGFPLVSEYFLTDMGKSFLPVIRQLDGWGLQYKDPLKEKLAAAV